MSLAVISTHPIQYHAPVFSALQSKFGVTVNVIYGSDFSIVGYHDKGFSATFAWDTDLLKGYQSFFLSRIAEGGARSEEEVRAQGVNALLKQLKPEAVLLLGYGSGFHRASFCEVAKLGYPILFRGETIDYSRSLNFLKSLIRDCALWLIYKRCFRLLYIGKNSYVHFKRLGCKDERLIFSPYCVSTAPFQCTEEARAKLRSITRQSMGITERACIILFSGKLIKRKGPDLLLRAMTELPLELREQFVIIFLGDGEKREALEHLVQNTPGMKARFLGFKNQSQLSPYYHAADLLVLPSNFETWGIVVNEALHHGLPCIVSDAVGCALDLIEPGVTGEIFENKSSKALALAIQRAIKLIDVPEIRDRCRERVSGYTVEKAAEGIARGYRDIASIK